VLKVLKEPLVVFFLWMSVIYLIASLFVTKRLAFWLSALATTYLWLKLGMEERALLVAWGLIFAFMLVVYLADLLFHLPPLTFLTGKKLCPDCYMAVPRKARVCPFCHYRFSPPPKERGL